MSCSMKCWPSNKTEIESAGLLVHEDEESVSIALDSYVDDATYRYIEHIPKVNVIELRRLSVAGTL